MTNYFIRCTPAMVRSYTFAADREFFSVPVQVLLSHCEISSRFTYVVSPLQGGACYPVEASSLKRESQLTDKQRAAARRIA